MAHLPTDLVLRLLNDDTFRPGGRPSHFRGIAPDALTGAPPETIDHPGSAAGWVFKETAADRKRRRHAESDSWRNCGGVAGARDLPAGAPIVRRRYGKVTPAASNAPLLQWCAPPPAPGVKRSAKDKLIRPTIKEGFAYHEYTLLDTTKKRADGAFADATEVYIFHIIPVKDAIIHAPRLGLPPSVCLSTAESRALSAVLRVQGFLDDPLPNPESNKILPQLPPTPTLDTDAAISFLCDASYNPGGRPGLLKPAEHGWLFKEPGRARGARRSAHEDRWKHSGGMKGAKDLYSTPQTAVAAPTGVEGVRRRNGVIQPPGKAGVAWRYHKYTLLRRKPASVAAVPGQPQRCEWEEEPESPVLFHVQPLERRSPKRRPPPPPPPPQPFCWGCGGSAACTCPPNLDPIGTGFTLRDLPKLESLRSRESQAKGGAEGKPLAGESLLDMLTSADLQGLPSWGPSAGIGNLGAPISSAKAEALPSAEPFEDGAAAQGHKRQLSQNTLETNVAMGRKRANSDEVEEEQDGQASPVVPVLATSERTAGPSVTLNPGAWGGAITQPTTTTATATATPTATAHPFRPCGAEVGSVGVLPRALSDGLSSMSLIENAF